MDRLQYTRFRLLSVTKTIALAQALLQNAPALPEIERGKSKLQGAMEAMLQAREQLPEKPDKVRADAQVDGCWRSLNTFTQSFMAIAPFEPELAKKAEEIHEAVFGGEGMRFVQLPYQEEWVESKRRLDRIDGEVESKLNELGGAPVLSALKGAHAAYGEALGLTGEQAEVVEKANLMAPLRALRDAIQFYTFGLIYMAEDESSEEMVKAALLPILEVK